MRLAAMSTVQRAHMVTMSWRSRAKQVEQEGDGGRVAWHVGSRSTVRLAAHCMHCSALQVAVQQSEAMELSWHAVTLLEKVM